MLAKRRSCNESVTQPRTLVSTTIRRTWWVFIDLKIILLLTFLTSLNLHRRYIIYYRRLLLCWPYRDLPARDTRYQSAVRFQEQSWFYLPRFTWIWGGRREATAGSPVVYRDESKVEGSKGSASRYLVSFTMISTYILAPDDQICGERFCFVLNNARPLLPLEAAFFEKARAGNGFFLSPHHLSSIR